MVWAAYLRCLGVSQKEVAEEVKVNVRTLRHWEYSPQWAAALQVARTRWLANMDQLARARLYRALSTRAMATGDAWRLLERLDPALKPPVEEGEGGVVAVQVVIGEKLGLFQGGGHGPEAQEA